MKLLLLSIAAFHIMVHSATFPEFVFGGILLFLTTILLLMEI